MADKEPELLGNGVGATLADLIPLLPSGARRAGAASLMAERIGDRASFITRHPLMSQIGAIMAGGAIGGAYKSKNPGKNIESTLLGLAPLAAVQLGRRHEIKGIEEDYAKAKKKKRLRELMDGAVNSWGGSSRLGAVRAFETMRQRKPVQLSAIAEAADAAPIALSASLMAPAGLVTMPITEIIDRIEAARLKKAASTQNDSPVIPAALAAALLGSGGQMLAGKLLHDGMRGDSSLDRREWRGLSRHVSGADPALIANEDSNAGHGRPKDDFAVDNLARHAVEQDPEFYNSGMRLHFKGKPISLDQSNRPLEKAKQQILDDGVIMLGQGPYRGAKILAHEAGHAKIEETPGVTRFAQRHLYPLSHLISPAVSVGSLAAGLKTESGLKGALLGTLIGSVGNAGIMLPELMASVNGLKGLKSYQGGRLSEAGQTADLARALGTYAAANVLPSTLSGMMGGIISGRRKKHREKSASDEVRMIIKAIQNAKKIQAAMGSDAADRHTMQAIGSMFNTAKRRLAKHPDVISAGFTNRTPLKKMDMFFNKPPSPPVV